MRTLFVLAAFVALVAVVGVSTSFGDDQDMIQQQLQVQLQLKDGSCLECVCATFVDEDGDGICDECLDDCVPNGDDDDGDGIPNGQDDDYVPPEDGTGDQYRGGK